MSSLFSSSSSAAPSLMDNLFQRTLDDLIKSLRHPPGGEPHAAVISRAVDEIRREIKSTDPATKSTALQKLSYLSSLYFYDMSWAAFHAVECVSSHNFSHKKSGYLAVSQSFGDSTPVILLITNQIRKDLKSSNELEVGLALECLSRIGTVDLCRDLTPEVFTLMGSSKVLVRKKAVGVVLRVFERYPDAVKVCFKRLVENLENSEPQVLCAVVGVFSELACWEPVSYLPLAPEFYRVLVDSRNNWVLIKVLKIFAKLAPLEPRLAKRIVEPICEVMRRTEAKSLMFECVRTVVSSLADYEPAVRLAAEKIRELLVDEDANLKFLGLHALSMLGHKHLWAVLENKEIVFKSLSDADPNIKVESLRLLMALVSENNLAEISRVLVNYALKSDPEFCNEILGSILSTCSHNVYEIVVDFDWYVSLLGEMSRISHCHKGEEIGNQLIDIGMRVRDARPELVRVGRDLLIDPALLGNPCLFNVLSAAAWLCGEYVKFSSNPFELVEALLQPRTCLVPPSVRTVYLQSVLKVIIFSLHSCLTRKIDYEMVSEVIDKTSRRESSETSDASRDETPATCKQEANMPYPRDLNQSFEDLSILEGQNGQASSSGPAEINLTLKSVVDMLKRVEWALGSSMSSYDVEVHERVRNILGFVDLVKQEICDLLLPDTQIPEGQRQRQKSVFRIVKFVHHCLSEELGPVSATAQGRVCLPDGLVLKENLADLDAICGNIEMPSTSSFTVGSFYHKEKEVDSVSGIQDKEDPELLAESASLLAEHRKQHGLYYLSSEKNEILRNDYPPANDQRGDAGVDDNAADLVKLAHKSLHPKRKSNHTKPRPVVVKLDDGESAPITAKRPEVKDDSLSSAVRDILFALDKSAFRQKVTEKQETDHTEGMEKLVDKVNNDVGDPSSRRSKSRSRGKDKGKRSPKKKNADDRGNDGEKEKCKSKHRHGKHKHQHSADGASSHAAPQSLVIPDLLL